MDLSGSMQGAGGVGGLLAVNDGTATYYPTFDGNGNVSEYLDSTGAVQAHYEYDAFGNTIVSSGTKVNDFSHRFSTKQLETLSGLYYYGYRWYDPKTGRWPSRDPIAEHGGFNLYGFISNDSIGSYDRLGLKKGLWFADGRSLNRKPKKQGGIENDWTIFLDTGGVLDVDPGKVGNNPTVIAAARAHEERHIQNVKDSDQSHAVPYKQVFCLEKNGVKILRYYESNGSKLNIKTFNKGDKMTWHSGRAVMFMTFDSRKEQEIAETNKEITFLSGFKQKGGADFFCYRIKLEQRWLKCCKRCFSTNKEQCENHITTSAKRNVT